MKTFISILLFVLPMTVFAQFCCCPNCPSCIPLGAAPNCGNACFFNGGCSNAGGATASASATCSGTLCNPLPIELSEFEVNNSYEGVNLFWSTDTETNNEGFEVQRASGLSLDWELLSFVRGAGTTTDEQAYHFIDRTAPPGINYYRLRQVDFDGTTSMSSVEAARLNAEDKYTLWPTLARDQVLVKVNDEHDHSKEFQYHVYDMMGRLFDQSTFHNGLTLDISNYPQGGYVVNIYSNGVTQTLRFTKAE